MYREIQLTADGSHTVAIPDQNLHFHSHHGAVQESTHVFIQAGLLPVMEQRKTEPIHILEIGFGTGLNALLSLREAITHQCPVLFSSFEKYPLTATEVAQLNHGVLLSMQEAFQKLHLAAWEQKVEIDPFFTLEKKQLSLPAPINTEPVHLVYFDAFAPDAQPELWTAGFFRTLFETMVQGGALVTYCSKSDVRRAMVAAGLRVEKIPGPWGKREMVRAWK
jgi:tRNA U34 5-methylaminomethyl-2-thiouridine-forming methyltransferase MnmC